MGPREATHTRSDLEAMRGDGLPRGGHGGAVERRERGRAARGGGASAEIGGGPANGDDGVMPRP
jgi:hypothetical protein